MLSASATLSNPPPIVSSPGSASTTSTSESQEVVDGVVVLGPVQAVHCVDPADVGTRRPGAVQLRLEPPGHLVVGLVVGSTHSARRHGARAQLGGHLLPYVGVGRRVRGVVLLQHQRSRATDVVVAAHAVLVDHGLRFGAGRHGGRVWRREPDREGAGSLPSARPRHRGWWMPTSSTRRTPVRQGPSLPPTHPGEPGNPSPDRNGGSAVQAPLYPRSNALNPRLHTNIVR